MPRLWKSRYAFTFLFSFLSIVLITAPARAVTLYDLTATTTHPEAIGSFTLQYADTNRDGLFSKDDRVDELVAGSFSGVVYAGLAHELTAVVRDWLAVLPPPGGGVPRWTYSGWSFWDPVSGDSCFVTGDYFTYSQVPVGTVPLPASVFLLASGLIPLAWTRRKKRLGK